MTNVKYQISGLEGLTKPGTYYVETHTALTDAEGDVTVWGQVVPRPTASDDVVHRVDELRSLLMRPMYVFGMARAKMTGTGSAMDRGAAKTAARAAAEIDRIVKEYQS